MGLITSHFWLYFRYFLIYLYSTLCYGVFNKNKMDKNLQRFLLWEDIMEDVKDANSNFLSPPRKFWLLPKTWKQNYSRSVYYQWYTNKMQLFIHKMKLRVNWKVICLRDPNWLYLIDFKALATWVFEMKYRKSKLFGDWMFKHFAAVFIQCIRVNNMIIQRLKWH